MSYKTDLRRGEWQRKRLEIMERDNFKCRVCSKVDNLLVHHLHYESGLRPWEYDNESMVTLCDSCHTKIHKDLSKIAGLVAFKIISNCADVFDLYEYKTPMI